MPTYARLAAILVVAAVHSAQCFKSFVKEIKTLPGLSYSIDFKQYSGYVQANPQATRFLHFWFFESQSDPASDPLLLWLQGGPGCSGIFGLLGENGPFRVSDAGNTLVENAFSWNKKANVLYFEAPAGVGYSFATDGQTATDDDQASKDNYFALKEFFKLLPKFRKNDFFISGESYGGVYIPTLAVRVIQGLTAFPLNFKGVAIGNGYLHVKLLSNTNRQFFYGHGFVDEKSYRDLETKCCNQCDDTCDFDYQQANGTDECRRIATSLMDNTGYVDGYAIFSDCASLGLWDETSRRHRDLKTVNPALLELQQRVQAPRGQQYTEDGTFSSSDPCCINDDGLTAYMNRKDVRAALFIPSHLSNVSWSECASLSYQQLYYDMTPQVRQTLNAKGVRVLIYNGDVDSVCNFLGDQQFAKNLGLEVSTEKQKWGPAGGNAYGFVTRYGDAGKLDFLTVRGSGHMVPACRPAAALQMIQAFVSGQPYNLPS